MMTNENEAPEQIWVEDERPIGGDCHVYNEPIKGFCNPIRYTLADLSDARIAELEGQNRELHMQVIASDGQAQMAYEEQERLEAKLAKAERALRDVSQSLDWNAHGACRGWSNGLMAPVDALNKARATIVELKGTD